jgi:tRNA threonylcarbamoyl adenosine modification protein YeaZ
VNSTAGWMLAFDASTARTVVALGRARELVCSEELQEGANQASTHLVPTIHAVLARAGIAVRDLSLVAVGRGPGTFTGARVAVATAKGLAHGLSIPALGVSTLAALAASAPRAGRVLALLDARRGEVHGAYFDFDRDSGKLDELGPETCAPIDVLLNELPARPSEPRNGIAFGPGVEPNRARLPDGIATNGPCARGLWWATLAALERGRAGRAADLAVVYLRETYAEMGIHRPKRAAYSSPFVDEPSGPVKSPRST